MGSKEIMETAVEAAKEAGSYASGRIGKLKEISHKDGVNNLVTDVDKTSEKMIIGRIKNKFPDHSVLAEESGEHASGGEVKWIIDPLDGTINYAHGFPIYCVSIAVSIKESVAVGVVYDPSRDELFSAEEGKGAFLNGTKISVSKRPLLKESLIATGFAYSTEGRIANIDYFKKMLEKAQAVRRAGSAALDLSYVACGRLDGFWEMGLCPWDTAAAQLILKEAGGKISKFNGGEWGIYDKEVIASNGLIHEELSKNIA